MDITTEEIGIFLKKTKILECFDEAFLLEILPKIIVKTVFSGDLVVRQDEKDTSLYLLYSGRLSILNKEKKYRKFLQA
jgi:hypothetical protein